MAEHWLAEETDAEGHARALRAVAYALRQNGDYGRSDELFTEVAERFIDLGLPDEAARARLSHVDALRYLGRYEDAIKLAQDNLDYLKSRGDVMQVDAARLCGCCTARGSRWRSALGRR